PRSRAGRSDAGTAAVGAAGNPGKPRRAEPNRSISRAMRSSSGAAILARFSRPCPSLRMRSRAAPICPSEVAFLLPVLVETRPGRCNRMQIAPGLAQEHRWHLGESQGLADPPPLLRYALEAQPDEGAREALVGANVAARELDHRPQTDAVEALHVLAESAAVIDLTALVAELGDRALQLEAVDHPALAVLDRRRLLGISLGAKECLAELREQRRHLVIPEVPDPGLGMGWRQECLVGELDCRGAAKLHRVIDVARQGAVLPAGGSVRAPAPLHRARATPTAGTGGRRWDGVAGTSPRFRAPTCAPRTWLRRGAGAAVPSPA